MQNEPLTHAEYLALPEEERELYGPKEDQVWEFDWVPAILTIEYYKRVGIETRSVHYPLPAPVPVTEGEKESVELISENEYPYFIGNMYSNSIRQHDKLMDELREAFKTGYHHRDPEITALQTALAEKDMLITALKRQANQQDKHKQLIKGYWLSETERLKLFKEAVKDYFDSEHQESIASFDDFIEQYDLH